MAGDEIEIEENQTEGMVVNQQAPARITDPINPEDTRAIGTSRRTGGGITFENYGQVIEFAKMMALTGYALPPHLRKNETGCLAICTRAGWWSLDPYFVGEHSYLVMQRRGGQETVTLAYDSSIFQAVVNSRAPIKHRLKFRYDGEGDDMTCTVWTTFIGEQLPTEHTSPPLGVRKAKGNSPLWISKPRVQLAYDTLRDWARLYCQDILGGILDKDELLERDAQLIAQDREATSPKLIERLPGRMEGAGFDNRISDRLARRLDRPNTRGRAPSQRRARKEAQAGPPIGNSPPDDSQAQAAPEAPTSAHASPGNDPPASVRQVPPEALPPFPAYRTALVAWLAASQAGSDIWLRYDSESPLRAGFTQAQQFELRELVQARLEQLV